MWRKAPVATLWAILGMGFLLRMPRRTRRGIPPSAAPNVSPKNQIVVWPPAPVFANGLNHGVEMG